ncbi:queuine tRNA-ribosyltransferase, putative [Plasmodium ovale curtisi]|uniref:Queuine tRNA-ribosyltransferase, putative n=1 Tax=Plasmodium ovale curtisi TaxID=864141 RepID=A0A1A8W7S0_PLAOA|nr:queuine tRNA-ribosyltransferase, putative [Plasmodium ovale curtisi]SBS97456.1 queuine tRNA-ribosyltransferase, putative [Plasmodium ovale curtisi]
MEEQGRYRVGKIKDLETPTNTVLTNDFLPEFINLRLVREIDSKFILNCPLSEVYNHLDVFENAKEYYSKEDIEKLSNRSYLYHFADFSNSYRYMNIRNVLVNKFSLNINKYVTLKHDSCTEIFSQDDFIRCVDVFEPEIFCIPTEEIKLDKDVGKKKKIRIITLMNEFLEKIKILKNTSVQSSKALCILSVPSTININKMIEETLQKYDSIIDAFMLSGIGYDESNQVRTTYLKNILNVLPNNKLKFIQLSGGNPIEILHSIYHGIDIIESNFPYYLARNGKAITMCINMEQLTKNNNKLNDINQIDFKKEDIFIIDLNDVKYSMDYSTITINSPRSESRSYIHHLLKCKELTAHVIITYHNLYLYKLFFQEIQTQIKNNNFLEYTHWFIEHHNLNS